MKILVVTQYFYPENFRINQLCLDLQHMGHQVSVLTGKPNYPKGVYFDGYSYKGNDDETWNDIPIMRVPLRARKKGAKNLILNYFSFIKNANHKVKRIKEKFDIIYVFEVSPITVALPAIKLKKRNHTPIIMNVQDLWPENIIAVTGMKTKLIISFIDRLVNYIYKHCDLILCASPSFVGKIKKRVKNKDKVRYWPQYASVSKNQSNERLFDENDFHIVFTGNIGEAQGIDIAIEAARYLVDTKIHWHFIGDGRKKESLEKLVSEYRLENHVTFHGFKEESEIPKYLSSADMALLILKPDPVFEMTIPAKLQTYLACGVPIIGCVCGEGKRIIEESKAGLVSDEISINGLISVCEKALNLKEYELKAYGDHALTYGMTHFNKNVLLEKLNGFMNELIEDENQRS